MRALALAAAGAAAIGAALLLRREPEIITTPPSGSTTPAPSNLGAVIGGVMDKLTGQPPRGIRNNNPLNIRKSADNWQGKVGDDGEFVIFDTPHNGIRAAGRLLRNYDRKYGLNTIQGIIYRWAPPTENDTKAYIRSMEKQTGLARMMILSQQDYPLLVAAMIKHENGQQPYEMALIAKAVNDGFA